MATSRDVQDIVSRLSSDRAKTREEGIKLLSSWMEGERSVGFCRLLARNTARIRPSEIPHAETWPFLVTLVVRCVEVELSAGRRRPPKPALAKVLRTAVQRAEDPKLSGKGLLLLSVVKLLFNHLWDVITEVEIFQSEYSIMLRQLLIIKEYKYQMRKRVYCGFVLLYMERVGKAIAGECKTQSSTKEEVFRNILTLHVLLENSPGDFPDDLWEDAAKGFIDIFTHISEEGKISRKLMECMNMYLLKVGPNLGAKVLDIHSSVQDFVFRHWLTTHDKGLKVAFFNYSKLQLNLSRTSRGGNLIEQLLDVIDKELDQTVMPWADLSKEDKFGTMGELQHGLLELAALAYYQACHGKSEGLRLAKQPRRGRPATRIKDGIMKGKSLWCGCFYFLVREYGSQIDPSILIDWFGGVRQSFERILSDSNSNHLYDGFVWLLRALKELPSLLSMANSEVRGGWRIIWNCLLQGLPVFSNNAEVADHALKLLGDIIVKDTIDVVIVPRDIWELRIFKYMPSLSGLYFVACYFSKGGIQNDLGDVLNVRRNLLRAVLGFIDSKEIFVCNEQQVILLPAAVCSLCTGCNPLSLSELLSFPERVDNLVQTEESTEKFLEINKYSVEVLADFRMEAVTKVPSPKLFSVRLPRDVRQLLVDEAEDFLLSFAKFVNYRRVDLPGLLFLCSFFCNCIHGINSNRLECQKDSISHVLQHIRNFLDHIACVIEESCSGLESLGRLSSDCLFEPSSCVLASLRSLIFSPFFSFLKDKNGMVGEALPGIVKSLERILLAFVNLFKQYSATNNIMDMRTAAQASSVSLDIPGYLPLADDAMRIVDMELDVDDGGNEVDYLGGSGSNVLAKSSSPLEWKLEVLSAISLFFLLLPVITWDVLIDLLGNENDDKVQKHILSLLSRHCSCHDQGFLGLGEVMKKDMDGSPCHITCNHLLALVCRLLQNTYSASLEKSVHIKVTGTMVLEQNLQLLVVIVNKISGVGLPDWSARIMLIECICCFISLDPCLGQAMIGSFLSMIQDVDYRVRVFLAKRIGLLFQTWDGHDELFHDICTNISLQLVMASRDKIVRAPEVLVGGPCSAQLLETFVVTLANVAFHSEKLELEVAFMICAVAAMNPCQRELIFAIFDNLSQQLQYKSRAMYLKQLIGPILFWWMACEVGLTKLIEIQDLFLEKVDIGAFMNLCCPWLLPSLIICQDRENLSLLSTVWAKPLPVLARKYFVQIFSVCIALHCSDYPNKNDAEQVLHVSLLTIAEISEHERDVLIKKHMVSIVSQLLSLSSSSIDPALPFFSQRDVELALRTVVDGFLEMDNNFANDEIVDRLNVFRPDRVFKFLVEIHYRIEAAVPPRHRCHRLLEVEILVDTLGLRAVIPSTSNYIFNILGQFIESRALQDQCCLILSKLFILFKVNYSNDSAAVLGKHLQFLVSKLVSCYISANNRNAARIIPSSRVMLLIEQLTVDADSSLYDFIRDLEPFPEIECIERIRRYHEELCPGHNLRDQFLKFVRRAHELSSKFLLWRLQNLHQQLLLGNIIERENTSGGSLVSNYWAHDPEVALAVWKLVGISAQEGDDSICHLIADFISRVGIGDPYQIIFQLPKDEAQMMRHLIFCGNFGGSKAPTEFSMTEEHLTALIKLLVKFLSDDCANTIDIASQALQGILSTERGNSVLQCLDFNERSLIAIHSKGINSELVEKLLNSFQQKYSALPENASVWTTSGKSYKMWIGELVHSLTSFSDDIILRLCQDIVLLKVEIAEFLLPQLLLNLAGRKDLNVDICGLVSKQVQEQIFVESNNMIKSVHVFLEALNSIRSYYVNQRASVASHESKHVRPSSFTRTRNGAEKLKNLSWEKVYWLSIDYQVVAKVALRCGFFFTAVVYVEYWCEEHFSQLTLGSAKFSNLDMVPPHVELLVAAVRQINEPDSIYGIIQTHKLTSQIIRCEHEENWSKALEYYDLVIKTSSTTRSRDNSLGSPPGMPHSLSPMRGKKVDQWKSQKGLMRSLQQIGCSHVLDVYFQGLTGQKALIQDDAEFTELQYEAAWRAADWDFSLIASEIDHLPNEEYYKHNHFNENLHRCLRALHEGNFLEFDWKIKDSKKRLVFSIANASHESTRYIHSAIVELQILHHLSMAWDLRWGCIAYEQEVLHTKCDVKFPKPTTPHITQMGELNADWSIVSKQIQLNLNMLEPFITFRRVLLQILDCRECRLEHLLKSASALRKGSRFSLSIAALQEFKLLSIGSEYEISPLSSLGMIEEAKVMWAQGQHELAINLANNILKNHYLEGEASSAYRLVGKWLAETRSCNSKTILELYLKRSVALAESDRSSTEKCISRRYETYFQLAHYTDALFRSYEDRLASSEWQAALRLREHKRKELDALIKRLKRSTKGEKADYAMKIQELQKQLAMDREEAKKLEDDRDNFLNLALEGYQRCLVIGGKYDMRVVFRLVSLWFSLSSRESTIKSMVNTIKEVQSYKFVSLMYQIASRIGGAKEAHGSINFQMALISLVKKMSIDHPYHTIYQLLALANGDRVKDKQRSRNSFVVDLEKKQSAEKLLNELSSHHGAIIRQMKQMVEIYIKLAELETRKEETNKKMPLPREIRSLRQLEFVPVVTATSAVDPSCQYEEGSFPYFKGLGDSMMVMNGINAPKVVECLGSDGNIYRQLAKSGNDDLRQDAVMEQFFSLVNTFLQSHRDTWKRRIRIRTYKVVPFTPSAGVLEWVNGTIPLGEYLIGSSRNGGAHGRYGIGDWSFLQCREHMANEKDKGKAFQKVCENFRPVLHHFFLERFLEPADWFEKRLSYTRSVAASSMTSKIHTTFPLPLVPVDLHVGYIVGLGDRHSMNILIDQATAEVVHIDLGVAFEQGLMLKTPERVPFRLTRDVIDGMGVTGVEGVFRRCCEETLNVMRTNKEALLTIIEVFMHDPLYKWALSPLKALQRQKELDDGIESSMDDSQDACEGNKDATRTLLRVKQKLDGYEEGEIRSIQGQVQELIQDAIDPERLSQMFPGWGAWM